MNQMENVTPIHKWVDELRPGDLIRVSYGPGCHYMGLYKHRRIKTNGAIFYYYDIPGPMHDSSMNTWHKDRLEKGLPSASYIYGYMYKDRIHPVQEWMLTNVQKEFYKKLLKFIKK